MKHKLVVDCTTGKQEYVPLSNDELLEFEFREAIEIQKRIDEEIKSNRKKLAKNKFIGQNFIGMLDKDRIEFLSLILQQLGVLDDNGVIIDQ